MAPALMPAMPGCASLPGPGAHAEEFAKPDTWTRELPPLPDAEPEPLEPQDTVAVVAVVQRLDTGVDPDQLDDYIATMLDGLDQTDPKIYEPALTQLGILLGAHASKPDGFGRCDSTWCWDNTPLDRAGGQERTAAHWPHSA